MDATQLHEFKTQFSCQRYSILERQSEIQLHETQPQKSKKFAFTLTEICLLGVNKMHYTATRPRDTKPERVGGRKPNTPS